MTLELLNSDRYPVALDLALFSGEISAVAAAVYSNERPPQGLAGLLDWRTRGLLSDAMRAGKLRGEAGECHLIPYVHQGRTLYLFLLGVGDNPDRPGTRGVPLSRESLTRLGKNLDGLHLSQIGISQHDLGGVNESELRKIISKERIWMSP